MMENNREIKFRAWDENAKCMVYNFKNTSRTAELNETGVLVKSCWHTLMQFTGLRDKNGKEIYESDIVKCFDHPTGVDSATGQVYYSQGTWRVKDTICPLADFGTAWTEIIGNVYENSELLNQQENG